MDIRNVSINKLHPYDKNPRRNDDAVDAVAASIKEFGFKVPIVVDSNGVIVTGHTRLKAAKKLGLTEVPVIVADDLNEDQIRAFRLADNKVGELAQWDDGLLNFELAEIGISDFDVDMSSFGFDDVDVGIGGQEGDDEDHVWGLERFRNGDRLKFDKYDESRTAGDYGIPTVKAVDFVPNKLVAWHQIRSYGKTDATVHFYIDDYKFEQMWSSTDTEINVLQDYEAVIMPDFSLYVDMPKAMLIWNRFRQMMVGQLMQDAGLTVIPNVTWAKRDSYDYVFDGMPKHSTVAASTWGCKKDDETREDWFNGMNEAMNRLEPDRIILYGADVGFDFGGVEVVRFGKTNSEYFSEKIH